MNHHPIEKKILLYLDSDLAERERAMVQEHLARCPLCSQRLEALARIWQSEEAMKRVKPSPYLWTRLAARIEEYEHNQHLFTDLVGRVAQLARPAFMLLMLATGIFVGIQLGHLPDSLNRQSASVQPSAQDQGSFFRAIYLDSLEDIPPESVAGVYLTLYTGEKGAAQ